MSRKERISFQKEIISQKYINIGLLMVSILSLTFSLYTFYTSEIYKKGEYLTVTIGKFQGDFKTYVMKVEIAGSKFYILQKYNLSITNTGDKPVTLTNYDIYKATEYEADSDVPLLVFSSNDEEVKFPLVISPKSSFWGEFYLSAPISKEVVRLLENKYNFNFKKENISTSLDFKEVYKYLASNNYDVLGSKLGFEEDDKINEFYLDSDPFYYIQFNSTEGNQFGALIGKYKVKPL